MNIMYKQLSTTEHNVQSTAKKKNLVLLLIMYSNSTNS